MRLIHILVGGPDRWLSCAGKVWRFEDHPQCGPVVLAGKSGDPAENQPPERHPFWTHVGAWYQQGKQTLEVGGKVWCKYETPLQAARRLVHIGGRNYAEEGSALALKYGKPNHPATQTAEPKA